MSHITNFAEARTVLLESVPAAGSQPINYKLDRMRQLMAALGNPQNELKIIHVAGTSGKTSTCYYIAACLQAAGQKVGLTISPHVDEVNERVQINLVPLAEKTFCSQLEAFLKLVSKTKLQPTYFELLVAFAFYVFKQQRVDYAVVEVGLGGLFDGTNIIDDPGKVCVITDIGFDHTDILGNTLAAIATQKAGIIGPHNPVFSYLQEAEVRQVIEDTCQAKDADLHSLTMPALDDLPMSLPLFQRRNWYLAEQVSRFVLTRDQITLPPQAEWLAAADTLVPARMEINQLANKTLIIDAAHNSQKMQTLVTSLKDRFPGQAMAVLIALVDGKSLDTASILRELLPIADSLIVTSFGTIQDMPRHSIDPYQVAAEAQKLGIPNVEVIQKPEQAFSELKQQPADCLLVTGSFYLLNHVRPHMLETA